MTELVAHPPQASIIRLPVAIPACPRRSVAVILIGLSGMVIAAAAVVGIPRADAVLADNLQQLGATLAAVVAVALTLGTGTVTQRRIRQAMVVILMTCGVGELAWDLQAAGTPTASLLADAFFVVGVIVAISSLAWAVFRELERPALEGLLLDSLILFMGGATAILGVFRANLEGQTVDLVALLAAVALLASGGAWFLVLVARRVRFGVYGPWVLLVGFVAVGAGWISWQVVAAERAVAPSDFLLSLGLLSFAYGGITWEMPQDDSERYQRVAWGLSRTLPSAAILACVGLIIVPQGPRGIDPVDLGTGAVLVVATLRQVRLATLERRARDDAVQATARLAFEQEGRLAALAALGRLVSGATPEESAQAICYEALGLGLDTAVVNGCTTDGRLGPLALEGLEPHVREVLLHELPSNRFDELRDRAAKGPYIDRLEGDTPASVALRNCGMRAVAYAPLSWNGTPIGSLAMGTRSDQVAMVLDELLPTVHEFGLVAGDLLGPALEQRERDQTTRSRILAIAREGEFTSVFQPIVDLRTRETIGFEALTRFRSGERPDELFSTAWATGAGPELEHATLRASLRQADRLPHGAWLSVNVSPRLLDEPERLRSELMRVARPVAVEVTEHEQVADYAALRRALRSLRPNLAIAVDDAGAGSANFTHLVELEPNLVKIDAALVRGVDAHLGRQALVIALRHYTQVSGSQLVAEGIETEAELATLLELGVDLGQGYLLGRPVALPPI